MRISWHLATFLFLSLKVDSFTTSRIPFLRQSTERYSGTPQVVEPIDSSECRLIICQITDVYTLEHLAHFKTLVEETKKQSKGATVVSMLTGDFLSPYLLSKVDKGGM
jgi:hypothetical protein